MDPFAAQGNDGLAALRAAAAAPAPAVPAADIEEVATAAPPRAPRPREETDAEVERAREWLFGGDPTRLRAAVHCLEQAEAAGNPVAGYWLAWVALGSVLLPRDGRINERMLVAVQHDHPPALRAAALHLGRKANPVDQALCVKLLERAAIGGDMLAAVLLAERLQRGEGCPLQPRAAAAIRAQLRQQGVEPLPPIVAPPVKPRPGRGPVTHSTLAFEEALVPPTLGWLAERPRLARIDGLLTSDECRLLVASAMLADAQDSPGTVRLDGVQEDFALRVLQLRLARAARGELAQAEPLQVECRGLQPGGAAHRDPLPAGQLAHDRPLAGNRRRTVWVCLGAAEDGGGLSFPLVRRTVRPATGAALVFDNLRDDGSHDACALHAEAAIERGQQWQATLWLRDGRYRDA